jgi:cytoskeletal protein RodZ
MTDFGRELVEARQRAGLSVEDLAHRTKISVPTLLMIERNQMKSLPGGIYTRGLLRAYAREVGIDPEDLVNRFRSAMGDESPADEQFHTELTAAIHAQQTGRLHSAEIDAADRRRARWQTVSFCFVLLFGGGLYYAYAHYPKVLRTAAAPSAVEWPTPVTAAPHPVGTTAVQNKPKDPEPAPGVLRLDIEARELCWLSATADGERVIYRLLNSGEHAQVEAKQGIDLRIGDPSVFSFSINGAAAHAPGAAGEATNIHLTPDNYRSFLGQ